MNLSIVDPQFIDRAWADGASSLSAACDTSGGEITADQLKLILSRGERTLVAMVDEDKPVGWAVFKIEQLCNMRVFFITGLVAPNAHFERFFEQVKQMASGFGCSRVRCSAKPAQSRLYRMKLGFTPVYETLEVLV